VLAVAMVIAALTITAIVMVVATSVQLRHRAAAQRAQAISAVTRIAARRAARFDWAIASVVLVLALGLAVLFLPGLVDGVSYVEGGHTATFVPQSYRVSCSYYGTGDCSTVTLGVLRTGRGGVRSTWPDQVPLGRPFKVREPVWTWGLGAALLDGDGIAIGAAAISLLFDGLALLAVIFFVKVVSRRLRT
jgi:hypothetical protein